ncbi:hypothetical protein J6A31_08815 [bacterium]|nr:hypothetical protein [bacterium]
MSTKKIQVLNGSFQSDWNETDETQINFIKNKPTEVLQYSEQSLSDDEQLQARTNIGAASGSDLDALSTLVGEKPVSEQIDEALTELGDLSITTDSTLDTASENPIQNKVVATEIGTLNQRIDDISITTDSELNTTSENPIQNKTVAEKFEAIEQAIDNIEADTTYPIVETTNTTMTIEPDKYTVFGTVSELHITLQEAENDGLVHEYCFEFTTADEFYGIAISPEPKWVDGLAIESNKTYQVSIVRGIGVIAGA